MTLNTPIKDLPKLAREWGECGNCNSPWTNEDPPAAILRGTAGGDRPVCDPCAERCADIGHEVNRP